MADEGAAALPRGLADTGFRQARTGDIAAPSGTPLETLDAAGAPWRRVWSLADRLVVEFIGVATGEVRDGEDVVVFDRRLPPPLERHLSLDHVLPLVLARRGELVVHAGVVRRGHHAVVLIGPSGAGKSTLVAHCGQRGWIIGGDDGVVLRRGVTWTAQPTRAGLRLTQDSLDVLELSSAGSPESAGKYETTMAGATPVPWSPVPPAAVVTLEPTAGAGLAEFSPLLGVAAHVALFRGVIHADMTDPTALDRVVGRLADLAESVPVGRLTVPRGREGLSSAETVLRRLLPDEA